MPAPKLQLGQLLLQKGLIDADQLAHAMGEQRRTGLHLAKILLRLGFVTEEKLALVLSEQLQIKEHKRIGELLVERNYITVEQRDKALEEQKKSGLRLGKILMQLGFMTEERLIEILSAQLEIPTVNLSEANVPQEILQLLPEEFCRSYKVIPLSIKDKVLTLVMHDPSNQRTLDHIRFKVQMEITPVMAHERDIVETINRLYIGSSGGDALRELARLSEDEDLQTVDKKEEASQEEQLSDEEGQQVVKLVNSIVQDAIARKASDIHLEPQETFLKLRIRIDGDLTVMPPIPARLMPQILSRVKLLARMDIAEKRRPLDGRFTVRFRGKEVDLRVSSFPVALRKRGVMEKIVMRILDPTAGQVDLDQMGFRPAVFKQIDYTINLPNGIMLVTGPTGSGKSTTLYASIRRILDNTINITTMEDPVEMNIEGVNQGQINNAAGFTFAAGIRAILRQDPDVILIGEMRDKETASMAIESALTGHLVFSTLHTNDASGAFPRLLEMGLEPFLVATAIKGVLAQRLVRKICSGCREEDTTIDVGLRRELGIADDVKFYRGKGCPKCDSSGYKGRLGLFEFLVPSEEVRNLILKRASGDEIKRICIKQGMSTLRMDGMEKARAGITTLEQVLGASERDEDQKKMG
ncbi:MAG: Flp pilus assembly complex ATPase component TadA [Candidatus Fibromonas sp.]|jgi:type IV pilus assembly protein PilB|nr:Flp pilus assembly complex ATPase component TadA [Candidatus Fibromonas sp.]